MGKNRNYTNYSKSNKPAETTPAVNPDENVQNLQETENKIDETLIPVGSVSAGTMLNPLASENTEPSTNVTPEPQAESEDQTSANAEQEPEAPKAVTGVVVNCEKLNIRETPFKTTEVLCIINKGEEVEVFEELSTDDFYAVTFGKDKEVSIDGYCMKQYIKINN